MPEKTWLKPWLCFSALGLGILLSIRPIIVLVEKALSGGLSPAAATIFSAVIGFSGVALTTYFGFRNLIHSQELQAKRDRNARLDQYTLQEKARAEEREHEKRTLAAALFGELVALEKRCLNVQQFYKLQRVVWEKLANDNQFKNIEVPVNWPRYKTPIFEANIARLGVLGSSVAGDVASIFGKVSVNPESELPKVLPEIAAIMAKGVVDGHDGMIKEMLHVSKRLSALQGIGHDPGHWQGN
ncbi:hypothetical protein SAMN05428967_2234 [Phyllobacterium sp. YR620]|uniref:hypothetical protein n=1 Tax=Phyllobacterium sp. YR620 TaxID=1881066 RepID=UPI0008848029|nr:hypothetical protein [Phyllobacterium sp. YR620]SDP46367.1 hypothetical protein SAMN05428967_2234 [Phyllobacterium sp. YR620]